MWFLRTNEFLCVCVERRAETNQRVNVRKNFQRPVMCAVIVPKKRSISINYRDSAFKIKLNHFRSSVWIKTVWITMVNNWQKYAVCIYNYRKFVYFILHLFSFPIRILFFLGLTCCARQILQFLVGNWTLKGIHTLSN